MGATLKFWVPEWWHEARTVLGTHKCWAPRHKTWHPGCRNPCFIM